MTDELHLESPAKVNLRLEILKKRKDGYHELRTIFQKIDLHDTLHFSLEKEKRISIVADHPNLPKGKGNLVDQAVRSILKRSDYQGGVCIHIEKRIPIGAGLGGGSSNVATALKALNQLLKLNLSKRELMDIGVKIGADVPFFFMDRAAIGYGIGERLKKFILPDLWFILIYPNFEVSTRWAYQNFILTKRQYHFNLHKFIRTPEGISRLLWNDLEEVVLKEYPQIDAMKKILYSAGALGALMTGSGPTVFGIFQEDKSSLEAFKKIEKRVRGKGWTIIKAKSAAE
jgi:4-diphosphocytidyl-2-C-methyl-D-erythritol kinase